MQYVDKTPHSRHLLERVEETPEAAVTLSETGGDEVQPLLLKGHFSALTPITFKKVMCPAILDLDSDHSGAEWTSSMATPSSRRMVQESPPSLSTTETTTEEEEEEEEQEEYPTTDESIMELRRALNTGPRGSWCGKAQKSRRTSLKFNMEAEGGRSVARTLFPIFSSMAGGVPSMPPGVTPSPLVCARRSPEPVSKGRKEEGMRLSQSVSCSQELFGTPVCTVPCSPPNNPTPELSLVGGAAREADLSHLSGAGQAPQIPLQSRPLVHSTPIHPSGDQQEKFKVDCVQQGSTDGSFLFTTHSNLQKLIISPLKPLAVTTESSRKSVLSNGVISQHGGSGSNNCEQNMSDVKSDCMKIDDVLDVLFMTSSQLEAHFTLQNAERGTEHPLPADAHPVNRVDETIWNFEERVLEEEAEKSCAASRDSSDGPELKKQKTSHFKYPRTKMLNTRKSRIRTREVIQKSPRTSNTTVISMCSGVNSNRAAVVANDRFRSAAELGLASPPVKKRLASVESVDDEGRIDLEVRTKEQLIDVVCDSEPEQQDDTEQGKKSKSDRTVGAGDITSHGNGKEVADVSHSSNSGDKVEDVGSIVGDCLTGEVGAGCIEKQHEGFDRSTEVSAAVPTSVTVGQELLAGSEQEGPKPSHEAKSTSMDIEVIRNDVEDVAPSLPTSPKHTRNLESVIGHSQSSNPHFSKVQVKTTDKMIRKTFISSSPAVDGIPSADTDNGEVVPLIPPAADSILKEGGFVGFKTAAGSSISVSAAALNKARQLLVGAELEHASSSSHEAYSEQVQENVLKEACLDSDKEFDYQSHNIGDSSKLSKHSHLKHPSFKRGTVPKQRGKGFKPPRMATDVPKNEEKASRIRILKGFGISPSGSAQCSGLSKDLVPLGDVNSGATPYRVMTNNGLSNTSGAVLSITGTGFQTAGGRGISVSCKSLQQAQEVISKECQGIGEGMNENVLELSMGLPTGFRTAGGKGMAVSAPALRKAQILEAEGEQSMEWQDEMSASHGCLLAETRLGDKGDIKKAAVTTVQPQSRSKELPFTTGFKTAGGRGISVSSRSLSKAKELGGDDSINTPGDVELLPRAHAASTSIITGFKTASGRELSVASESLARSKEALLHEMVDGTDSPLELGRISQLKFQGPAGIEMDGIKGSGNVVKTTSSAEERGCELSLEKKVSPKTPFVVAGAGDLRPLARAMTGFKTASGQSISVNMSSLDKAQQSATSGSQERCSSPSKRDHGCEEGAEVVSLSPCDKIQPVEMSEVGNNTDDKDMGQGPGHLAVDLADKYEGSDVYNDSNNCLEAYSNDVNHSYLNTQVVRQFLNFSDEEQSLTEGHIITGQDHSDQSCCVTGDMDVHSSKEKVGEGALVSSPRSPPREQVSESHCCYDLSESAIVGHMNLSSINGLFDEDSSSFAMQPSQQHPHHKSSDILAQASTTNDMPIPVIASSPATSMAESPVAGDLGPSCGGVVAPALKHLSPVHMCELMAVECEDTSGGLGQQEVPSRLPKSPTSSSLPSCNGTERCKVRSSLECLVHVAADKEYEVKGGMPLQSSRCHHLASGVGSVCGSNGVEEGWSTLPGASDPAMTLNKGLMESAGVVLEPSETGVNFMNGIQLDDIEMSEDAERGCNGAFEKAEVVAPYRGFQTASGKAVGISESALKEVRVLLEVGSGDLRINAANLPPQEVCLSRDPIEPLQAVSDRHPCGNENLAFRGFHTAAGRRVKVCEKSLRAARNILDGTNDNHQVNSANGFGNNSQLSPIVSEAKSPVGKGRVPFKGFQTAGGRTVEVSEKSLETAKALLAGAGDKKMSHVVMERAAKPSLTGGTCRSGASFPGLQTASGKKVEVTENSLMAAKSLLGESSCVKMEATLMRADGAACPVSGKSSRHEQGSCLQTPVPLQYPGLQTAAGRQVRICQQSLQTVTIALGESGNSPNCQGNTEMQETVKNDGGFGVRSSHGKFARKEVHSGHSEQPKQVSHSDGMFEQPRNLAGSESLQFRKGSAVDITRKSTTSRLREMQAKVQRAKTSLTSIPEATLCDRKPFGKRLFPPQPSLAPVCSPVCPTPVRHTPHSSASHQNSTFSLGRDRSQGRQSFTHSHVSNQTYKSMYSVSNGRTRSQSISSPPYTFMSPQDSSVCNQKIASGQLSYTAAGRVNFSTPTKGKSMKKSVFPSVWNTPISRGQRRGTRPVWLSSTPKDSSADASSRPNKSGFDSGDSFDVSATNFHLTLSQIHEMEESQKHLEFETHGLGARSKVVDDDSGYTSREVSALKSPSPDNTMPPAATEDLTVVEETSEEDLADTIFAEVAMEDLDDTLDHNTSCDSPWNPAQSSNAQDCPISPNINESAAQANAASTLTDVPCASTDVSCPTTNSSSSTLIAGAGESLITTAAQSPEKFQSRSEASCYRDVKPRCGYLLDLRLRHKSGGRIPLLDAMRDQLPASATVHDFYLFAVSSTIQNITSETAQYFRFSAEYFSSGALQDGCSVCVGDGASLRLNQGTAGVEEFWSAFKSSPGVEETLISNKWLINHFKHLVVKLGGLERSYPRIFSQCCLTPDWLMLQLKYRYDREIDRAERSAIHRMCEHDDVPSRRIIFYVSKVYPSVHSSNESVLSTTTGASFSSHSSAREDVTKIDVGLDQPSVELSDGWYDLPCVLDRPLRHMLKAGRIKVGMKLIVCGAELVGLPSPCHPLDVPPSCCLKISANSTRRARWDAKLGYQRVPLPFLVRLDSLFVDGGLVGSVVAVVARVYPVVYLEKKEGSKSVMRCARVEEREQARQEREREKLVEDISSRVRRAFENEVAQQDFPSRKKRRSRRLNALQVKQLMDGEEIYSALMNAQDPQAIQDLLSGEQLAYLDSYKLSLEAERQAELQRRMKAALQEAEEKIPTQREVIPLLRLRLVSSTGGCGGVTEGREVDCQLSVWRPQDQLREIKEGTVMRFSGITANRPRYHSARLQLTASRSTGYEILRTQEPVGGRYELRLVARVGSLTAARVPYKEFDAVAMVVHVSATSCPPRTSEETDGVLDMIYMADTSGIMVVKSFGGIKAYGLEDVVSVGAIVSLSNLIYKGVKRGSDGGSVAPWPTAHLTDITVISHNPRNGALREALVRFKNQLQGDQDAFLKKVEAEIRMYL